MTPFSLFDDEDEDEEQDLKSASKEGIALLNPMINLPQPSALQSGNLLVDEMNLIPTDPT